MKPLTITLIATGGTIAKSYFNNGIANQSLIIDDIIANLRLPDLTLNYLDLMRVDSLDMKLEQREEVAKSAMQASAKGHAVVITHGTDTMVETGSFVLEAYKNHHAAMPHPVVMTAAMLPYVMKGSDALQNITEALLAVRILPPKIYIALHNRILALPHVRKNRELGTFETVRH